MRGTEGIEEIDVVLDIVYNPETQEVIRLEKSEWHQSNRPRFNPDEGGYPYEVPGGGIELDPPYTEDDIIAEGLRELVDETTLEKTDVGSGTVGDSFDKMQDGVHHTFYPVYFETSKTGVEKISDEHEAATFVGMEEYYNTLGYNEIRALRQFIDPFS